MQTLRGNQPDSDGGSKEPEHKDWLGKLAIGIAEGELILSVLTAFIVATIASIIVLLVQALRRKKPERP